MLTQWFRVKEWATADAIRCSKVSYLLTTKSYVKGNTNTRVGIILTSHVQSVLGTLIKLIEILHHWSKPHELSQHKKQLPTWIDKMSFWKKWHFMWRSQLSCVSHVYSVLLIYNASLKRLQKLLEMLQAESTKVLSSAGFQHEKVYQALDSLADAVRQG